MFNAVDAYTSKFAALVGVFFGLNWKISQVRYGLAIFENNLSIKSRLDLSEIKEIKDFDPEIEFKNAGFTYSSNYLEFAENLDNFLKRTEKLFKYNKGSYYKKEIDRIRENIQKERSLIAENEPVLRNINLKLQKNKVYALVGKNGAGKSTMISMIMRLLDTQQGEILIGGTNIKHFDPVKLKSYISLVSQRPYLAWGLSVWDNIVLQTNREIKMQEVEEVLNSLQILDRVKKSEKGINSVIGENVNFSGGEEQILDIARSLIKKPGIMLFDEATNQLDPEKELKIFEEICRYKQERLIIFITHRMTVAKKCDEIIVLDQGEVQEQGMH
jgi:ABC-type multidrug transport system fused ATPase/permease subunit